MAVTHPTPVHTYANDLLAAAGWELEISQEMAESMDIRSVCPLVSAKPQNCYKSNSTYITFPSREHKAHIGEMKPGNVYTLCMMELEGVDPESYLADVLINAVDTFEKETGIEMNTRDILATAYDLAYRFLVTYYCEEQVANELADEDKSIVRPDDYNEAVDLEKAGIDVKFSDGHTVQVKINGAGKKDYDADEKINVQVAP